MEKPANILKPPRSMLQLIDALKINASGTPEFKQAIKEVKTLPQMQKFELFSVCLDENCLDAAYELLKLKIINISHGNDRGETPLFMIARRGQSELLNKVLKMARGCNLAYVLDMALRASNQKGETALHAAVLSGDFATVELLIDNGLSLQTKDQKGRSPLFIALMQNLGMAKSILARGVASGQGIDLRGCDEAYASLPLSAREEIQAVGDVQTAFFQVASQSPPALRCRYFSYALQNFDFAFAEKLIDAGVVSVSDRGAKGETPLHIAAEFNQSHLLTKLATGLEGVDIPDAFGCTPLHRACESDSSQAAAFLLSKGADHNAKDEDERTPAAIAMKMVRMEILEEMHDQAILSKNPIDFEECLSAYAGLTPEEREEINEVLPAERVVDIKVAGHVWGLSGNFRCESLKASYTGLIWTLGNPMFFHSFKQFLQTLPPSSIFAGLDGEVQRVEDRMYTSPQERAEAALRGELVMIPMISPRHIQYLVLQNQKAYICNRGEGTMGSGAMVCDVHLKETALIAQAIAKIDANAYRSRSIEYYRKGVVSELLLEPRAIIAQKPQKVGNCTLASLKTAFYTMLVETATAKGVSDLDAQETASGTYKAFTAWQREQSLSLNLPKKTVQAIRKKLDTSTRFDEAEKERLTKLIDDYLTD